MIRWYVSDVVRLLSKSTTATSGFLGRGAITWKRDSAGTPFIIITCVRSAIYNLKSSYIVAWRSPSLIDEIWRVMVYCKTHRLRLLSYQDLLQLVCLWLDSHWLPTLRTPWSNCYRTATIFLSRPRRAQCIWLSMLCSLCWFHARFGNLVYKKMRFC